MAVFRCLLDTESKRAIEIPQWMFDAAACCRMMEVRAPHVTCAALRELVGLLAGAEGGPASPVVEAEHLIPESPGGARELEEPAKAEQSADTVSADCAFTLDRLADGSAHSSRAATRAAIARAPARRRKRGGAR